MKKIKHLKSFGVALAVANLEEENCAFLITALKLLPCGNASVQYHFRAVSVEAALALAQRAVKELEATVQDLEQ
jgi:hypothetical protein